MPGHVGVHSKRGSVNQQPPKRRGGGDSIEWESNALLSQEERAERSASSKKASKPSRSPPAHVADRIEGNRGDADGTHVLEKVEKFRIHRVWH